MEHPGHLHRCLGHRQQYQLNMKFKGFFQALTEAVVIFQDSFSLVKKRNESCQKQSTFKKAVILLQHLEDEITLLGVKKSSAVENGE